MKEEVDGCCVESLCRIAVGIPTVCPNWRHFSHIFVQKSAKTSHFQIITFSPFIFTIWYPNIGLTVKSQNKQNMNVFLVIDQLNAQILVL